MYNRIKGAVPLNIEGSLILNSQQHSSAARNSNTNLIARVIIGRTRGGVGGGGGCHPLPPLKVFLSFFLGGQTSAPEVFSSCSFIPRAHFESKSVLFSFYGYEI